MLSILMLSLNVKITFCIEMIMITVKFKTMYLSIVNCVICKKERKYDIN